MCQFKLDVPQFLIQMQTVFRSAFPPGLQPTLTKVMAECKDTVVKIYKIKQHALKLQTDANAAKREVRWHFPSRTATAATSQPAHAQKRKRKAAHSAPATQSGPSQVCQRVATC